LIRGRWARAACLELKAWAIVCALLLALCYDGLKDLPAQLKILVVWYSLMLFSRIAIWVTIGMLALLSAISLSGWQPPDFPFGPLLVGLALAILIRAFLFLNTFKVHNHSGLRPPPIRLPHGEDGFVPKHDWDSDSWIYEDGNKEPAHIRFKPEKFPRDIQP
jgi:hypothetical protein